MFKTIEDQIINSSLSYYIFLKGKIILSKLTRNGSMTNQSLQFYFAKVVKILSIKDSGSGVKTRFKIARRVEQRIKFFLTSLKKFQGMEQLGTKSF